MARQSRTRVAGDHGRSNSLGIAAVAIIMIVWAIIDWFYRRLLSSKNIQIEILRGQLADYRNVLKGASPSEAAYKITQLKAQLEAIKGVPRDENVVDQKGKRIGEVAGVRIDASSKSLVFDRLTLGANLDQTSNIEFRNLVLAFAGMDAFSQTRQGRTLVSNRI
jgi:hypothetical protein